MTVAEHVVGLDGCPGGWICARWDGGGALQLSRVASLADVFAGPGPWPQAAVDIPIGLPDRVGPRGRAPERIVRAYLGPRQSSVFSVPSRAAVEAGTTPGLDEATRYRAACAAALATSDPPKMVSKQCFHIFPKIMEADQLLRARPDLSPRLVECHPEVSFWAMAGEKALDLPKKVKGVPFEPGLALRIGLLERAGMPVAALDRATARQLRAGLDDLVDACAGAWTALRIARGTARSFPDPVERDAFGLPIAITV